MSFPQPNFPVWVNRPRDIPKTLGEFHIELFGWPSDIYQTYPEYQTHQGRAIVVYGSHSCTTMLLRNTSSCLSSSGRKCSTPDFWWYLNFRFLTTCGSNSPTFTHKPAIYTDAHMLTVARNEISIAVYPRCLSNRDANDEFCPRYRVPAFAIPLVVRYLIRTLVQIDPFLHQTLWLLAM